MPTAWLASGQAGEAGLVARLADDDPGRNRGCGRPRRRDTGPRRSYNLRAMKVGIIGLGYVGLPLAVAFAEARATT